MRLKNKDQLVELIGDLDVNEGFDFVGHYENNCNLTFGVRHIEIIDSPCIVFGGYGAVQLIFDLNHNMIEEIVEKILKHEGLKITDIETLEQVEAF